MPSKADWIVKLPDLPPGKTLHVYPRDGLTVSDAETVMKVMGYNMRHYQVGLHGNALLIRRWYDVANQQKPQPEFARR